MLFLCNDLSADRVLSPGVDYHCLLASLVHKFRHPESLQFCKPIKISFLIRQDVQQQSKSMYPDDLGTQSFGLERAEELGQRW